MKDESRVSSLTMSRPNKVTEGCTMITLYHGSNVCIKNIDLAQCNPYKDFGQAFYLTADKTQAMDVANARVDIFGGEPVLNEFHFDENRKHPIPF